MKGDDIRRKMLTDLNEIKRLMLSGRKVRLLKWCKTGLRSTDLKKKLNISIQSASVQLAALHRAGYLDRTDEGSPAGGSEYIYSLRV